MRPIELLSHAEALLTREANRPTDADLRRAASACYYALFHAISDDAAAMVAPGGARQSLGVKQLRSAVRRTIAHTQVRAACIVLNTRPPPIDKTWRSFLSRPLDGRLTEVAEVFVELQETRYSADYDSLASFTQKQLIALHVRAKKTHATWLEIHQTPNANIFLTAILLGDKLGKRG